MNPKEKAQYLFDKMYWYQNTNIWGNISQVGNAKQCALVVVDEIINVIEDNCLEYDDNYWQEVRNEIELL